RKVPMVPESFYYQYEPPALTRPAVPGAGEVKEDLNALVRRLRHMYQVGLVKVLQGAQVKPSLGMMCRALERPDSACGATPLGTFWWVASAALTAISDKNMLINKSRKLLFSGLDREIKRFQQEGKAGLQHKADPAMLKELLYLVALSRSDDPKVKAVA